MSTTTRYRGPIIAAAIAGVIWLFFWILWLLSLSPDWVDQTGTPAGWDFNAFHSAATLMSEGVADLMYRQPWLGDLTGPPFVNPPFTAWFFLPFASLEVIPAWLIWSVLSVIAMAIGFRALGADWLAATAAAMLTVPVFFALRLGQTSLVVFMLMSLGYAALRSDRLKSGGATLGLVVFKPQLLIGFVFWWLSRWRQMRPAIVGGVASGGLLVALSLILHPTAWVRFLEVAETLPRLYAFGDSPYYEFAMWNLIVWDAPANPAWIGWSSLVLTVAAGLGLVWFVRRVDDDLPLAFSGAVVVGLLGTAHLVVHDWTLLFIPAVLLWQRLPAQRIALAWMGVALLYSTIFSPFLMLAQLDAFGVAGNLAPIVLMVCTVLATDLAIRQVDGERRRSTVPVH